MLAEDNVVNQKVGLLMISKRGHTVDTVATGADAVAAVRRAQYDLVLMDVHMPELDGLEATRRIRDLGKRIRQPRIVALTASVSVEDRAACTAAGMDGYLSKPLRPVDLAAVLDMAPADIGALATGGPVSAP